VLTRALALLLFVPLGARAAAGTLIEPERLTVGAGDQLLSVLDPAGERMFYVSNENAVTELFAVDLNTRAPQRLFDEAANATWPRVSPDGKTLLYLSFRSAATGELCFRDLTPQTLSVSDRRCISLGGRTAMHALWEPLGKSKSVLVLSRQGLGGAIDVRRFLLGGADDQPGELLFARDLSSPALSPDGRYLLYAPVARQTPTAQPQAQPRKRMLGLVRIGDKAYAEEQVTFALPGFPGFPAFSADGKYVYFVQYLNDTNHDGVVDANDRGVLFRVPFDGHIDGARAEQLTSAEWDCTYPFPGKERLAATCLDGGSLTVYSLPPGGAIPQGWDAERVKAELVNNAGPWAKLLLYERLLELDPKPLQRAQYLKAIIELHVQMREHQSTGFFSGELEKLSAASGFHEDEGLAQVMHELARHRAAAATLGEGASITAFTAAERARVTKLEALQASKLAPVSALAALVISEIVDGFGERGRALSLLAQVHPEAMQEPMVLHLYGVRARTLFEALCDRERLLAVDLALAEHPGLEQSDKLAYAEDYLRDLLHGRTAAEKTALLAQSKLPEASNAAFVVEGERALQGLSPANEMEVETRVFALFDKTESFERRQVLVRAAVLRATKTSAETLWYDVAAKWAAYVGKVRPGLKSSEELYRKIALERAYTEWAAGSLPEAREHFAAVVAQTGSLEAVADEIDVSLQAQHAQQTKASSAAIQAEYQATYKPDSPVLLFALAQLGARKLAEEANNDEVAKVAQEGKQRLLTALHSLPNNVPIHYLWAYLRHEEYLRTGDKGIALRANSHYLTAVDLAGDQPRYLAAALASLGFLHARLGNHSMAASFFERREKFPFASTLSELSICLGHARSLLHSDHESEAAALADKCVALIDTNASLALGDKDASLARFLPFALDHAGLYHADAGEPAKALAAYERLAAMVDQAPPADPVARRNQFVVAMGRASAHLALKQYRESIAALDRAEALFAMPGGLSLLQQTYARKSSSGAFTDVQQREDHEVLLSGLRARALTALGDYKGAEAQSGRRLVILEARTKRDGANAEGDDDRKLSGLAEANLAVDRFQAGDMAGAVKHVEAGLVAADELGARTATPTHSIALTLLREYADLHFEGHVPLAQLKMDLPGRLAKVYGVLTDRPEPRWREMRERYRVYLERLIMEGVQLSLP
jgi:tetratricopeptide (TPR) repeat protein